MRLLPLMRPDRGPVSVAARFRMAPLAAAVCVALVQYAPAALAGPDLCTGSIVRTCEGNQSAGISFTSTVTGLNVFNLLTDITPGLGTGGVVLTSKGAAGGAGIPIVAPSGGDGQNSSALSVHFLGDGRVILTTGDIAYGIFAGTYGGVGGNGTFELLQGGSGGAGGRSGGVSINSSGAITTVGHDAHGIYAISDGGDGGSGGNGTVVVVGKGGNGGAGGPSGVATVVSDGAISTSGDRAQGISAQSLGGAGGKGGFGEGLIGVSGGAARGGTSGDVAVTSSGIVTTHGADARGIFAQSVGGFANGTGGAVGYYAFGASGESGGDGGDVTTTTRGVVTTAGKGSDAVLAQSVGGGGGTALSTVGNVFALGGSGSAGGDGGTVTVGNAGRLETSGEQATGIFAQSVGGGGGDGAFSFGMASIGGSGGAAGQGDAVKVNNCAADASGACDSQADHSAVTIKTSGGGSPAIFAQSLGGGGGNGGLSVGSLMVIGGRGDAGGNGGSVAVNNWGRLDTAGDDASAIVAQSVGGGGGNGGGAVSASAFLGFGLGGSGASGGSGGGVDVSSAVTTIKTQGDRSHGMFAQSVGGGGGSGGYAVTATAGLYGSLSVALGRNGGGGGDADAVNVDSRSTITTGGQDAHGIFAQSIGGGGGTGGFSIGGAGSDGVGVAITYGGSGGSGGNGQQVEVVGAGAIDTAGDRSMGLLAQSVGGGGGNGGFQIAGSGGGVGGVSLTLGGNGNIGGNGGAVIVDSTLGSVTTRGELAHGVVAQSLGGGGGSSIFSVAGSGGGAFNVSGNIKSLLGTAGGDGGNGGTVALSSGFGSVTTAGEKAYGLFAQSAGGGGGFGGVNVAGGGAGSVSVNGNVGSVLGKSQAGTGGDSSMVSLTSTHMNVQTSGANATGIVAQSAGGGGGMGGVNIAGGGAGSVSVAGNLSSGLGSSGGSGGVSGTVTLSSSFDVVTTAGDDAIGLLAQSAGGGGGMGAVNVALSGAGEVSVGANVESLLGSGGGVGGNGGIATLAATGAAINTHGARSAGIVAQSTGGGGGFGGVNVAGSGAGSVSVATNVDSVLGSSGGGGGNAKAVSLTASQGSVATRGEDAHGLLAESVGGGGGVGAVNIGGSGAGSVSVAANVNSVLGSSGADSGGGDGQDVNLTSSDMTIETSAARAAGVVAQSIGGGGGFGGVDIAGGGAGSVSVAGNVEGVLGSSGRAGGDAGAVDLVSTAGSVTTLGAEAHGLLAQSVGGGGGMGAVNVSGSGAGSVSVAGSVHSVLGSCALEDSPSKCAGGGGDAKSVDVVTSSRIATSGARANGVFAQSLGGGGGDGGVDIAGSGAGKVSASLALGGSGGAGGASGNVSVRTTGDIVTLGSEASGVLAQSVGGGGGVGASSWSGSVDPAAKSTWNVTVGGDGGGAGRAADVGVDSAGSIDTGGPGSHGIFAQSLGGGGGAGGQAVALGLGLGGKTEGWKVDATVAVGGAGGTGNVGGRVDVANAGKILTRADDSHGVFAQSVGGGGGDGGSSFTATLLAGKQNADNQVNGTILVGGSGGSGNDGGAVAITNRDAVETWGDKSNGIFAQSIGGGGGNGGSARGYVLLYDQDDPEKEEASHTGNQKWEISVSVGGSGGSANNGGSVRVENTGRIETRGELSHGILAQSIGGGGGTGGDGHEAHEEVGIGTLIDAEHGQAIYKGGKKAYRYLTGPSDDENDKKLRDKALEKLREALVEQLHDISILVGGNAGKSGNAGEVVVENDADIVTAGYGSIGILAQSVGGGGGLAQHFTKAENAGGSAAAGLTGKFAIGGAGGAAGDGGAVRVEHSGRIDTFDDDAHGIFAQSVGGGGGVAGNIERPLAEEKCPPEWIKNNITDTCLPPINIGIGIGFGHPGGSGGDGGAVTVTTTGDITTRGAGAHGIKAQSVGGGGGAGGGLGRIEQAITGILFDGSVGGAGSGGAIAVKHAGNITTLGPGANGIFAQSAGGTNTGGKVDVDVSGNVVAQGEGAHGIFAQSVGGQGGGDIAIRIDGGTVQGGSGTIRVFTATELPATPDEPAKLLTPIDLPAAGVRIEGGANNTLTNHGAITTAAGVGGMAASGTTGKEIVENFGTITGSVDFGAGTNAFNNNGGATFNSGAQAVLGAGNSLTNAGTLSPGGTRNAAVTTLSGNLQQTESGILAVDLDHAMQSSDRVEATGTADLAGKARVQNVNAGRARTGVNTYTILTSAGGVTDSGLGVDASQSAVVKYQLVYPNTTDVLLKTSVDFSPAQGLNANQRAIGANINAIQNSGGSASFAPVTAALFELPDSQALAAAYDQLSAEGYLATSTGTLYANEGFSNSLLSCRVRDGDYRFVREGDCGWMRFSKGTVNQDRTSENLGFHQDALYLAGGFQRAVGNNWHVGLGVAYQDGDIDVNGLSSTTGDQVQIGAVLKGRTGATTYSAAATLGKGWYDTDRYVNIPTPGVVAASNQNVGLAGARLRLAHEWPLGKNAYVRPMIDAALTYARFAGFNEAGAGGADLQVASRSETWVSVIPAVEVGGELELADRTLVRPSLKLGITQFVAGTDPRITASFSGAPAGVAPFTVTGEFDRTYLDVDAGVDVLSVDGAVLRVGYLGRFSQNVSANGATLKFSLPF